MKRWMLGPYRSKVVEQLKGVKSFAEKLDADPEWKELPRLTEPNLRKLEEMTGWRTSRKSGLMRKGSHISQSLPTDSPPASQSISP